MILTRLNMGNKLNLCVFLLFFWFIHSKAKDNDLNNCSVYYYKCELISKQHQQSWLLAATSKKNIIDKLNFNDEDSFIASFNKCTCPCDFSEYGILRYTAEEKKQDEFEHIDSLYWCSKDLYDNSKSPEYQILLGDSSVLYVQLYKIRCVCWWNKRIVLSSRNPPFRYYENYSVKGMNTILNIQSINRIKFQKRWLKNKRVTFHDEN